MINGITVEVLQAAGWSLGRDTDVQRPTELLEKAGFTVPEPVKKFMAEFEGLILHYHNTYGKQSWLELDIERTLEQSSTWEQEFLREEYNRAIECEVLTLIGRLNNHVCIVMSETGMIYSIVDGYILQAGKGIEALDGFISKDRDDLTQIYLPEWW